MSKHFQIYKEATTIDFLNINLIKRNLEPFLVNFITCAIFSGAPTAIVSCLLKFTESPYWFESIYFLGIGALATSIVYCFKKNESNKHVKTSKALHNCIHYCRDEIDSMLATTFNPQKSQSLGKLCKELCEYIQITFQTLKGEKIGVAIRIAELENNKECYTTFGRAGLNSSRAINTESIDKNEGVAKKLIDAGASGCAITGNIRELDDSEFKKTLNDKNYEEVISMIAIPMNCANGKKKEMMGILFITSPNKDHFSQNDVEYAKYFADTAALMLSHKIFESNYSKNQKTINQRKKQKKK